MPTGAWSLSVHRRSLKLLRETSLTCIWVMRLLFRRAGLYHDLYLKIGDHVVSPSTVSCAQYSVVSYGPHVCFSCRPCRSRFTSRCLESRL
ncbi:uncharacterized protein EI90DRAFT_3065872 [Cantharellus anzutake]|uniref:uncharacterized protein n=1 Tax=Cantharellus anzutake TaxID=1750568 RepID=UPI0019052709|nr:uncharacterized protein EI90DRAFT_3065872 [Cantharellus anzutake]KAF8328201.1 hypothetical protein EI90DRAFT_3065872 [Cantharellus anzutake]